MVVSEFSVEGTTNEWDDEDERRERVDDPVRAYHKHQP